jgi:NDP-sugar pyrophosphorylase family protein
MKAVVLAAGRGARLKPWTDSRPKVMIWVGGKPPLERHLEGLRAAGIKEVFVNLHHLPEAIRSYFGDGEPWGLRIRYSYEPELLGTAGAVKILERELGQEPFLVIYGDNTIDFDFSDFMHFAEVSNALGTMAVFKKDDTSGSGVVEFDAKGRILRFLEKPEGGAAAGRWVNAGIYCFGPRLFEFLEPGFSDFGRDVFPLLLKRGETLLAYVLKSPLLAVDTLDLLRAATGRDARGSS